MWPQIDFCMLDHLRVRVGRAHVMDAALAIQMHMHKAIGVRKLWMTQ